MSSVIEHIQTVPLPTETLPETSGAEGVIQSTEPVENLADESTENGQPLNIEALLNTVAPVYTANASVMRHVAPPTQEDGGSEYDPAIGGEVAHIDAVDRQVDAPVFRGPVDVQVWTSRVRNPA